MVQPRIGGRTAQEVSSMSCYPPNELARFLDGCFSEVEAMALDAHLSICAACRETLDGLTRDPTFDSWLARQRRPQPEAAPAEPPPALAVDDEFLRQLRQRPDAATPPPHEPPPALPSIRGLEVLRPLGQGGMGIVFEAYDPQLRRRVAVKMLGRQRAPAEWLDRIRLEAEAAARLSHPHVVQIYAVGDVDGQPYVVLEYVGGGTLADRLQGRPQPPREAAALAARLARAIHFAHERHVIHRDLKPRNVLIADSSPPNADTPLSALTPKITDFGLAKLLDSDLQWTRSGQIVGTPAYAAPEQLNQSLGHRQPGDRRLRPGRDPVRNAHRPRAAASRRRLAHHSVGACRGPGGAAAIAARHSPGPGNHLPALPGEGARAGGTPAPRRWPTTWTGSSPTSRSRLGAVSPLERLARWSRRNKALAATLAAVALLLTAVADQFHDRGRLLPALERPLNQTVADFTARTNELTDGPEPGPAGCRRKPAAGP